MLFQITQIPRIRENLLQQTGFPKCEVNVWPLTVFPQICCYSVIVRVRVVGAGD